MANTVITGLGLLGDFGDSLSQFSSFVNAPNNLRKLNQFNFDDYFDTGVVRRADELTHAAIAAATLALKDAKLELSQYDRKRVGIIFATSHGPLAYTRQYHQGVLSANPALASPILFSNSVMNAALGHLTVSLGVYGHTIAVLSYAPVLQAFKRAQELIDHGLVDFCLVGGGDIYDPIMDLAYQGCIDHPKNLADRFGGCFFFLLEKKTLALNRSAKIYAQLDLIVNVCADYSKLKKIVAIDSSLIAKLQKNIDYLLRYDFDDQDSRNRGKLLENYAMKRQFLQTTDKLWGQTFSAGQGFTVAMAILSLSGNFSACLFKNKFGRLPQNALLVIAGKGGYSGLMILEKD